MTKRDDEEQLIATHSPSLCSSTVTVRKMLKRTKVDPETGEDVRTYAERLVVCRHVAGHLGDGSHIFAFHQASVGRSTPPLRVAWRDGDDVVMLPDDPE